MQILSAVSCNWFRRILCVSACFFLACLPIAAQSNYLTEIGPPPTHITIPVELGFIDLTNGNLHLEIPLGQPFSQRGKLTYEAKLVYDSRIWVPGVWGLD